MDALKSVKGRQPGQQDSLWCLVKNVGARTTSIPATVRPRFEQKSNITIIRNTSSVLLTFHEPTNWHIFQICLQILHGLHGFILQELLGRILQLCHASKPFVLLNSGVRWGRSNCSACESLSCSSGCHMSHIQKNKQAPNPSMWIVQAPCCQAKCQVVEAVQSIWMVWPGQ